MSMAFVKTRKVGGSFVITLSKELVEEEQIEEGEIVEVIVRKLRRDGFGVPRGKKPFRAEDELKAHE